MYESSDPRAALASPEEETHDYQPLDASFVEFSASGLRTADTSEWYARSQNLAIAYAEVQNGARLERPVDQATEYMAIALGCGVAVETPAGAAVAAADSVIVVPAGPSVLTSRGAGRIVRLFTSSTRDIAERAINASGFDGEGRRPVVTSPRVDRVGVYPLDVPAVDGRFGRIYSSPNIMVNVMYPADGARDTDQLSPHSHAEFEQCSITIDGDYVHHLRWPWNNRLADWRDDAHRTVQSPSLTVIPPGVIHTTRAVGEGIHLMIDAFSPPRRDFAAMPGWVLNATEPKPA